MGIVMVVKDVGLVGLNRLRDFGVEGVGPGGSGFGVFWGSARDHRLCRV